MRKIRALAAVVVLSATASGCWLQSGFDSTKGGFNAGETTITAANVANLEVAWTTDVGTAAQEAIVRGGTAFVRSDGALTAVDVATGQQLWTKTEVANIPLRGTAVPAIVEGSLRVPADGASCVVLELDAGTGERVSIAGFGSGAPFLSSTDCLTDDALDVDGAAMVPFYWTGFGVVPRFPCSDGNPAHWARQQGVGVVDVGGNVGWDGVMDGDGGCGFPPDGVPQWGSQSVSGDEVLVVRGGNLRAYPLSGCPAGTTCPSWSLDVGSVVGPPVALANGDIAVVHPDGSVDVIDGTTHLVEWRVEPPLPSVTTVPLAANATHLFVSIENSGITGVGAVPIGGCGADPCGPEWAFLASSPVSARPSIGGGVLYVGESNGTITARSATCSTPCPTLFRFDTGSRITGAPVIHDGTLLVGSEDGTVTAFRLPD